MSLSVGKAKIVSGLKELMLKWEKTREFWNDPASQDLEKTVLTPLEPKVRATVSAMERIGEALHKARRECGND